MDSGEIEVDGHVLGKEDADIRQPIGIVFQDSVLDPLLTVWENIETRGSFYGLKKEVLHERIQSALQITGIVDLAKRRYGNLSGGQKRRADIARALVNRPKILFLDEPTTGLDPQTRKSVWDTIKLLQEEERMTVFLTTHYMEEADDADYVVIIDEGQIAAKGTPTELKDQYSQDMLRIKTNDDQALVEHLERKQINYQRRNDLYFIGLSHTLDSLDLLNEIRPLLTSFQVLNGSLDDAFIQITGKEIRE